MVDSETGNTICFNGEIYNFRALRGELERNGFRFSSQTDTEVLLKAYACWGPNCVQRLRGMFAFAIWDARSRCLFLARDRVGIKPLYYARVKPGTGKGVFLLSSELRALLATGLVARKLNTRSVSSYLWNGFVPGPESIAEGISNFPAGTWAIANEAGELSHQKRYWSLPKEPREKESSLEKLASTLGPPT